MYKRSTIIITLLLSLGIASSALAYKFHQNMGERIEQKLTEKLELSDAQQAELNQFTQSLRTVRKSFRQQRVFGLDKILPLLDANKLDQEQAREMVRQRLAMIESQAEEMIASVADFTDSLTSEQRVELKEMIENRMQHGRRHHGKREAHKQEF